MHIVAMILNGIMSHFNGTPIQFLENGLDHTRKHAYSVFDRDRDMEKKYGAKDVKTYRKEKLQRLKNLQLFCDFCLKLEEKDTSGRMSVCAPCNKIGKEIRYCNRYDSTCFAFEQDLMNSFAILKRMPKTCMERTQKRLRKGHR